MDHEYLCWGNPRDDAAAAFLNESGEGLLVDLPGTGNRVLYPVDFAGGQISPESPVWNTEQPGGLAAGIEIPVNSIGPGAASDL